MAPPSSAKKIEQQDEVSVNTAPTSLKKILVALDASEHANHALEQTIRLSASAKGEITGIHAYAAQLHDQRFRQMEGGLPERYLEEEEMDFQREVHDDLISRGLSIISDSYHDAAAPLCEKEAIPYHRLSPEGKNYSRVIEAAESGQFDVLAMGALGLGAVPGSLIGTVCERVVRRSPIDVFVVKDTKLALGDGPIVVATDGSAKANGALKTGLDIGRRLGVPVHVVAAYDPYYHYVAFNKIAGVLSEEAGKVFRFKEQEKLHEELIDDGIAKIYQSHLEVSRRTAEDDGFDVTCTLLEGKPFKAVITYLEEVKASLLLVGKTGVHADENLDIGGNAENLLRLAPCHVWLTQTEFTPPMDVVAEETTSWSHEAEAFLAKAPGFVQNMARKAVLRHAQKLGHTFITTDIVKQVAGQFMGGCPVKEDNMASLRWSDEAKALVDGLEEGAVGNNIRLRAEKRARRESCEVIQAEHVIPFLDNPPDIPEPFTWAAAALARLSRVPEAMREKTKPRIEQMARDLGAEEVTLEIVEAGLEKARECMQAAMKKSQDEGG